MATKTKSSTTYACSHCGHTSQSFLGRCPECQQWGTLQETVTTTTANSPKKHWEAPGLKGDEQPKPTPITDIVNASNHIWPTGFSELDRVLGGGIVSGSYVLIGGDPGIGKSTLMLQMAASIANRPDINQPIWWIAGEESPSQIHQRAERLGCLNPLITIMPQTKLEPLLAELQQHRPPLVIVDSIQSLYTQELNGTPGSVNQVKACATALMQLAKNYGITVFLIGHVTKDGQLGGPKVLEHLVDTVLYFEGDEYRHLRMLRGVKNRFGNTHEIGIFEIDEMGLKPVNNASQLFLGDAHQRQHAGSVITATMEGARPLLIEVQALVGQTTYSVPRRLANGVDLNRLHKLVAVLERRVGVDLSKHDVYANVVGGLRVDDPAIELAIAMAILSSFRDKPVKAGTLVLGEVGLTGEIRPVRQLAQRLNEAEQLGLSHSVIPAHKQDLASLSIKTSTASSLITAIPPVFGE